MRAINPEAVLVSEHFHDAGPDLAAGGWHANMNYSAFTRPVWTWLVDPAQHPGFLGHAGADPAPRRSLDGRDDARLRLDRPVGVTTHQWNMLGSHDTARLRTVVGARERVELAVRDRGVVVWVDRPKFPRRHEQPRAAERAQPLNVATRRGAPTRQLDEHEERGGRERIVREHVAGSDEIAAAAGETHGPSSANSPAAVRTVRQRRVEPVREFARGDGPRVTVRQRGNLLGRQRKPPMARASGCRSASRRAAHCSFGAGNP